MNRLFFNWMPIWVWILAAGCRHDSGGSPGAITLAAANSYLECAARDVLGVSVNFVRLAEPGTCPGHFDLRPSQASDLNRCRAMLRFDFQSALDARLAGLGENAPRVMEVRIKGGMCEWRTYADACRQTAEALVSAGMLDRVQSEERLRIIDARMGTLAEELTKQIAQAGLTNLPVLASGHQKAFCEALGLRVVASFRASDAARMSEVDQAIKAAQKAGVKRVIANLAEGTRLAEALAERLGGRIIVFGNFPDPRQGEHAFDQLVRANVRVLLEASR